MTETPSTRTYSSAVRRWRRRFLLAIGALILFYAGFLALGFVPVNLRSGRPSGEDCVRLFVRSNEVHTDLVLPVWDGLETDWRAVFPPAHFQRDVSRARYVAVGWGNRTFFVETPRWEDFRASTACRVLLLPSEAVLHVEYLDDAAPDAMLREVIVTRQQYRQLAQFVNESVREADSQGMATPATPITYGANDRFYLATGRYHAFNTCNQWTGRGLDRASVPVGIWTPLKWHVLYWLPREHATVL